MPLSLIAYLCTTFSFLGMDFVWLSLSGQSVYKDRLGKLMLDKPLLPVAAGFYLMYGISLVVFAVMPALEQGSWIRAAWGGALLGFTAYGAYDLTNQATLVGWPVFVSVVDMAWGTFASGVACTVGYFLVRAIAPSSVGG